MTSIGYGSFSDCIGLKTVTMQEGIKAEIDNNAFDGCTSLSSINLPEGITSFGYHAFGGCTSLTDVTIPSSVSSIEGGAFSGCTKLADVYYNSTRSDWNALEKDSNDELDPTVCAVTIHCTDDPPLSTGDLDGDNAITTSDAYNALLAYSKVAAGGTSGLTAEQEAAADVDGDGKLTSNDAYLILKYYSIHAAGQNITWEQLLAQ